MPRADPDADPRALLRGARSQGAVRRAHPNRPYGTAGRRRKARFVSRLGRLLVHHGSADRHRRRHHLDVSEQSDAAPALEIAGLTTEIDTRAGTIRPVDDVSLRVQPGQTLCLVGESGSGKSMLALSLMRVLPAGARTTSGRVSLAGRDITQLPEREMRAVRGRGIAIVPQDPMTAFDPLMTVGAQIIESIRTHLSLRAVEARTRMLSALEQVHLPNP